MRANGHIYWLILSVILALCLTAASCAKGQSLAEQPQNGAASLEQQGQDAARQPAGIPVSQFRAEVLAADYSSFVSRCQYFPLYSDASAGSTDAQRKLGMNLSRVGNDIPAQNFSPGEKRRLGVQVLPNGQPVVTTDLYFMLLVKYQATGRLPRNAEEYLDATGCFSGGHLQQCLAMTEDEKYSKLALLINPATGRLYQSFQSQEWEPFGINIEVVPQERWHEIDPQADHYRFGSEAGPKTTLQEMVHVVQYGDREGSVIEDFTMMR